MPSSPFPTVRTEIQEYLRCCERLLSAALMPDHPPFSEEEEQIIEYYAVELLKLIPRGRPVPEYRQSILEYIRLSEALLKVDDFSSHERDKTHAMLKRVFEKLSKLGNDGKP